MPCLTFNNCLQTTLLGHVASFHSSMPLPLIAIPQLQHSQHALPNTHCSAALVEFQATASPW